MIKIYALNQVQGWIVYISHVETTLKIISFMILNQKMTLQETFDFLKFESETHIDYNYKNIHIIGNPPFGRQKAQWR